MTEYRTEFKDSEDFMQYMFDQDVLSIHGIDESGEFLIQTDLNRAKEVCPPFFEALMEDQDKDLIEMYEAGLINIEYNDDLEVMIGLTEKGIETMKQYGLEDEE